MPISLKMKRFDKSIDLPSYEKRKYQAACFDFMIREEIVIQPKTIGLVKLNVAIKVPEGYALMLYPRSSTPLKKGLMAAHSVGVGDAWYCGDKDEFIYEFFNITDHDVKIEKGESLVQGMLIKPEQVIIEEVEVMNEDGNGGYILEEK